MCRNFLLFWKSNIYLYVRIFVNACANWFKKLNTWFSYIWQIPLNDFRGQRSHPQYAFAPFYLLSGPLILTYVLTDVERGISFKPFLITKKSVWVTIFNLSYCILYRLLFPCCPASNDFCVFVFFLSLDLQEMCIP